MILLIIIIVTIIIIIIIIITTIIIIIKIIIIIFCNGIRKFVQPPGDAWMVLVITHKGNTCAFESTYLLYTEIVSD